MTTGQAVPVPASVSPHAQQWLSIPKAESTYPAQDDTAGWLAMIEQADSAIATQFTSQPLPVSTEDETIAGVPVFVVTGPGVADDDRRIHINFHGGGLFMGGGAVCRAMTGISALSAGLRTWGVDYRMPPLHPFPAALDDAMAVYRAALEIREPHEIVVAGGSAGGNIAAALLLRAKDEGLPMPAALVLNTPELDLTESGDSFVTNAAYDNLLSSLREVNELYAAGQALDEPYLSPLFGDVTGFPPTFLKTGTRDLFLSNTVRMHRKLRNAGVEAELHVGEAMPHGGFGGAPEDQELDAELQRFLTRHTAQH
ncbi:alpha/beta hydrolase [Curtobacterium sp. RIT-PI-V]|uniref:alpha/beta hydrolase n=1 Tax=Curtobacterium sp. RIT-PI-V TaxID=3035296 RepID=UPI0021D7C1FF|nr:alpha/beta hydrolase [Curtobacterium sp. RIT-PI-V]